MLFFLLTACGSLFSEPLFPEALNPGLSGIPVAQPAEVVQVLDEDPALPVDVRTSMTRTALRVRVSGLPLCATDRYAVNAVRTELLLELTVRKLDSLGTVASFSAIDGSLPCVGDPSASFVVDVQTNGSVLDVVVLDEAGAVLAQGQNHQPDIFLRGWPRSDR